MNKNSLSKVNEIADIKTAEDLLKKIKSNPKLLDNLSEDRLDKLISYYEKKTSDKMKLLKYNNYLA